MNHGERLERAAKAAYEAMLRGSPYEDQVSIAIAAYLGDTVLYEIVPGLEGTDYRAVQYKHGWFTPDNIGGLVQVYPEGTDDE